MEKIADYQLLLQLGEESLGRTYKAETPSRLGVAAQYLTIKIRKRLVNDEGFSKLCLHLATANSVQGPHVAQIYDVGQEGDYIYVASEFFDGGSLEKPALPLSRVDVLSAVSAAAQGAHELHEVGLTHCAITPGNIMVSEPAKVTDISFLNILSPGQILAGAQDTTPIEFQSPERIQGQPTSRSSDIWALGTTLHKVLTGHSIFPDLPDETLLSSVRHILNTKPIMSDALRNGERRIIERALDPDPSERFETAAQMSEAIAAEAKRQEEAGVE